MVSSKEHDETERGRSSSRSNSSFSRSSSVTTPGPSNAYYPYPYMSQAFQYPLSSNPEHAYAIPPGTSSGSHLGSGLFPNALALPRNDVDMTCAYPGISHTASRKVHTHAPSPFSVKFEASRSLASQLQSGTPNPCSVLGSRPPPVHGLSQGRVDLPPLCFAGSSTTHRPAPATTRASNWETWGVSQPPLTLPSTSSRKSMIPPDGIPAGATTWFAPSSPDPIQAKPIPDLLPHYGRGIPPVTPFIPLHRVHVGAYEEELEACKHTLMLQQTTVGAIPASRLAHCVACELTSNLWLCLTCGSLGCGRRQALGGNGHALNHFKATGHPASVKLGTITPESGADIWCYKCNDFKLDPALAEHLSVFGIDVKTARKTDKSIAEIRAEMVPYSYPSLPAWVTWDPAPPVAASGCSRIAGTPPVVPSQVPQMGHFPGIPAPRIGYGSYPSTPVEPSAPYDPWGPGKHPRFWHADGDLRFVVENTEYQLHSYLFSRATTPSFWLSLTGSKFDFDRFLSVLYPADYSTHECKTAEEWTSVLRLADKWGMEDIRRLAITQLTLCAGPVDKIALGHQYGIAEWLRPAYLALVMRKQSITVEEGAKLGVEALVRLRALEDEVYSDPTEYIDEKLFCEVFKSKLPAQQQPINAAAQQPLAGNISASALATVVPGIQPSPITFHDPPRMPQFMASVGQPPAPAPLTPIRFSDATPEFIPFLNYSPHRVIYQDAVYPSAMHLHEAMKFLPNNPAFAERIRTCADVGCVYALSKKLTRRSPNAVRSDWASVYLSMMEEAILLKFRQNANLQEMLLSTGDAPLIYADAEDTFWGEGPDHNGMNNLGLLLQRIRTQLRSESRLTS